ncbi:ADP-ribosylation factor-like protein 6-interacting protein 1 [Stomoxys calcitrans]|uniref:RETREG1-3/ARL6IP-like N-terminal reticulon-homology domain-containing protein n=1 Tax=Stomoxys calcitrans TaxID=35570 RepID=A0A1I8PYU3_STOCA|nr:ADP-ribosylation factor-like protein 6-interacting protein 1 [Stomoxys calcitrans]
MSQVDQKRAFNKMKHDLEPWRNLIVHVDALLVWEKNFYPAIIFAGVSIFFLALWAMDLSIITLMALAGLMGVLFDFLYPTISRVLFNADQWNGGQEARFETVVTQLCDIKFLLLGWYEYLFANKEKKSTVFVIIMSVALLGLAWIGAIFNNLLLMYFIILGVTLYPGVQEKGVLNKFKEKFGCLMNSKMEKIREVIKKQE